ncbi:siderophore-interacting protein [Pseudonocardia sp. MH-G8]|uniref:siderophore-interacting protein n=1 Tax=Pseudonocardia sp. MH-G8 TaxID=1854588 RepID=UPI000BA03BB5|nr:siderophore-interacting protein [Pseudonocardia sp. MH-G8]OZM81027.1 NADPH-dependent ferric siderophore reductase [Pseudonocardia sp. MH-G8]
MTRERHLERIGEVRAGASSARVPYPIRLRECEVLGTRMVGSALLRLTLGGDGAEGFESHAPCEHVKLIFPDERGELRLPEPDGLMLAWPRPLPVTREYTVRRYDAAAREIDIDIALHAGGLAADWATSVAPGVRVHVAGPPGGVVVPDRYDSYLLGGDITALPAIARRLEELPRTAAGWAFIEVADASEEIELDAPEGVVVRWLHRGPAAPGTSDVLERAVRTVQVPRGERVFVWLAGEAGVLKPLRRWVRDELRIPREDCDITGYWRRGVANFDEDHNDPGNPDHDHDHDH